LETITIKDIARLSGVGVSTVSRAINNHPDINEETKVKIMQIINEYNYVPNNSARNLKRSESKSIAVLIKGISNPFFSKMLTVFEEEIQKKKYSFFLQQVKEKEDEIDVAIELIKEKKLKGIVFLGGFFTRSKEKLKQLNIPFVLSTIGLPEEFEDEGYSTVAVDDVKESCKMVDYLCSIGHRRIAIIAAHEDDESIGKLRLKGYEKALEKNNIPLDRRLICSMKSDIESYSMENGYVVAKELLESGIDFTALYSISDSVAIGASKAIFDAGGRIPEDYSVAGFDGLDMAYYYQPSITTMRQPVEEMARESIRILFDIIRNKAPKRNIVFPAELIVRQSTRKLP